MNTERFPMVALRGMISLPDVAINFDIGREKSINALNLAMKDEQLIFLVTQKDANEKEPTKDDIYQIGTVANVKQVMKMPNDIMRVVIEGEYRAKIEEYIDDDDKFMVEVSKLDDSYDEGSELEAHIRAIREVYEEGARISNRVSPESILALSLEDNPHKIINLITAQAVYKLEDKQEILSIEPVIQRLERLHEIMADELEIIKIENTINKRVRSQIDKMQKEHFLHEQVKAIQSELGQGEDNQDESMIDQLEKLPLDDTYKEKISKEINRLKMLPSASPEVGILKTWLDWVFSLPFNESTQDSLDLKNAQQILDEDHYGLAKVKDRIVEYLAVRAMTNSMKGPILCFVGPPGVGKTSIAKSIARATSRKFIRMSLGGVRDEAEIRGHRRTYIGAIPGRIISNIKSAKSNNPVFLLDEIEKMSNDFRGDPSSALLEVLDSEQNSTFTDHYMEIPFDLSQVMFLATANTLETIPPALLDRMEIIQVSGYTDEEKLNIAKKYLLPKQLREHGMGEKTIKIPDIIMLDIINSYTREAGVRSLERELANICRKCARDIIENKKNSVRVTATNIEKYLGVKKYHHDDANQINEIGTATGLAWTRVGGVTLSIEVNVMDGSGKLKLTGQLGDVMKESASAALSYIRANADTLGIEGKFYEDKDIHIHIPEGATPKDGPSAGITMATAMISALTKRPIRCSVAMTGEITLRGKVLPIGGLKEKTLAAHRAGITKVIIPKENEKDIIDIPEKIRKILEIVSVSMLDEVLIHALEDIEGEDNED